MVTIKVSLLCGADRPPSQFAAFTARSGTRGRVRAREGRRDSPRHQTARPSRRTVAPCTSNGSPPHVLDDTVGLSWPIPIRLAPAATCIPTAPARFAHRSWRAPATSTTSCSEQAARGRRRSTSSSAPDWTPSHSAIPTSTSGFTRWTSPALRSGSGAVSPRRAIGGPRGLQFVPVDFESGESWPDALTANGFDTGRPAVVSSTGVSMYLTREATEATLRQVAALARGSVLAMTFMLPLDLADPSRARDAGERRGGGRQLRHAVHQPLLPRRDRRACAAPRGSRRCGTSARTTSRERYFAGRTDGLRPPTADS